MGFPELGPQWLITLEHRDGGDRMTVTVEPNRGFATDDGRQIEHLRERLRRKLRDETLVTREVDLAQPGHLPTTEGKAERVRDVRGEG